MRVIEIVPYDPFWPHLYRSERQRIVGAISYPRIQVEHVGSTAVPGLAAKPIIDILVGIPRLQDAIACIAALTPLGYRYVPAVEVHMPYRRFLFKLKAGRRTHHVHILETSHKAWHDHLMFRDYLRCHPGVAYEYEELKRSLAKRYRYDAEAYTLGKGEFVRAVLKRARLEICVPQLPQRNLGFTYEAVLNAIIHAI